MFTKYYGYSDSEFLSIAYSEVSADMELAFELLQRFERLLDIVTIWEEVALGNP